MQRTYILTGAVLVTIVATLVLHLTGWALPRDGLRYAAVLLGGLAGGSFLTRALLRGFSRAGWRAAAEPLAWAVAMLALSAANITARPNLPLMLVMVAAAVTASVLRQRELEARR